MAANPDPKQGIILTVDDNEAARYMKARVLRAAGYTVFDAGTAAEAFEIAVRQQPHLAVLDVKLPDMDGITLARTLKSDARTAAMLILQTSATFVQGSDRVRSLEGGADSYLVEPLEPEELLANVHALLRLSHAEKRLRENDRLLRLATQAAHLSVWSAQLDPARTIDSAASAAEHAQIAALQGSPDANGEPVPATVHPEDRPLLEAALRNAIADSGIYEAEYRVIPDIGEVRWIAANAMVLGDAFGRPAQLIGVIQDVTARKQAELEREVLLTREQAARKEAEEATRLKDEFLATLSHELRTPLNAIMGWIHLLRSGRLGAEDAARGLEVIKRNADAQSELINDLLDVSRIVSGKMRLDAKPVALDVLVEAAIDSIRPTADAKGVVLQSIVGTSAGVVSGDAERLQQVVWNLLSNAVKFSRRGAARCRSAWSARSRAQ